MVILIFVQNIIFMCVKNMSATAFMVYYIFVAVVQREVNTPVHFILFVFLLLYYGGAYCVKLKDKSQN